ICKANFGSGPCTCLASPPKNALPALAFFGLPRGEGGLHSRVELALPDPKIVARRKSIVAALKRIVPDGVVADEAGLAAFDGDALTAYRQKALVCVLPRTREQVSAILELSSEEGVPIVPRGA